MHEHLVACKQTCGLAHLSLGDVQINGKIQLIYWQLVLVSIYSFVRSFGVYSFRRDDITVANKVDVLNKHRVRKLQDHLTFFFSFRNEYVRENSFLVLNYDLLKIPLITALGANN